MAATSLTLRFEMPMVDISDIAASTDFEVFKRAVAKGGQVKAIRAQGAGTYSRKQIDDLVAFARSYGAKGLAWAAVDSDGMRSSFAKFLSDGQIAAIAERAQLGPGDLLLAIADKPGVVAASLGALRVEMAKRLNLLDEKPSAFGWVTDFPLLEWNEAEKRYDATHHPFTSPKHEDLHMLDTEPLKVRADCYDVVCNGMEVGSGSIRIHRPDVQERVFQLLNYTPEEIHARFGHLLGGVQVRCAAPRRDRPGHRSAGDAAGRRQEHTGRDRLPEEPGSHGLDDGGAVACGRQAVEGTQPGRRAP